MKRRSAMPLNEDVPEYFSGHINLNEFLSIMERILIIITRIMENTENNTQLELLRSIDSKLGGKAASAEQDIMRAFGV